MSLLDSEKEFVLKLYNSHTVSMKPLCDVLDFDYNEVKEYLKDNAMTRFLAIFRPIRYYSFKVGQLAEFKNFKISRKEKINFLQAITLEGRYLIVYMQGIDYDFATFYNEKTQEQNFILSPTKFNSYEEALSWWVAQKLQNYPEKLIR